MAVMSATPLASPASGGDSDRELWTGFSSRKGAFCCGLFCWQHRTGGRFLCGICDRGKEQEEGGREGYEELGEELEEGVSPARPGSGKDSPPGSDRRRRRGGKYCCGCCDRGADEAEAAHRGGKLGAGASPCCQLASYFLAYGPTLLLISLLALGIGALIGYEVSVAVAAAWQQTMGRLAHEWGPIVQWLSRMADALYLSVVDAATRLGVDRAYAFVVEASDEVAHVPQVVAAVEWLSGLWHHIATAVVAHVKGEDVVQTSAAARL